MRKNRILRGIVSFILMGYFCISCCFGQQKFERESRISKSDLPAFAVDFQSLFKDNQSMKWYREEGLNRESIETKYRRNGKVFSVEFDTLGVIEDVEIKTKLNELPEQVQENICNTLEKESDSYAIDKIQRQYTGSQSDLEQTALSGECADCTTNYEVVVRMKHDEQLVSFEYLFDHEGSVITRSEIVIQTSSHLEY